MSGPPILFLLGVLPEALQNSAARQPLRVCAAFCKSLRASQLRILLSFGPVPAFDGLSGVVFTPRRPTVFQQQGVIMQNRVYRLIALAAGLMLASGCSGDNPAAPAATSDIGGASIQLASAIKSDIAASAGNAIATDLETLIANQASAVGSFAIVSPSFTPSSDEQPSSSTPPSTEPKPPASNPPASNPPSEEPKPAPAPAPAPPAECSFNAASLIYSCAKSAEGKSVVRSYQFLDAAGNPMEKFVRGTTESIHYLVRTDASESNDNSSSVSHSLRDLTVSGFLGPNRIWNGFGSNADTSARREELSSRKYTGLSVDTLKAVTFVDERAAHPYPLSGVAIRVVDYTVVSTGKQLETTTVHKRVVVTFNGTADVPISLGDYSCVLHLDTHKVDGCK